MREVRESKIRQADDKTMDIHVKKKGILHVKRRAAEKPDGRREKEQPGKTPQSFDRQGKKEAEKKKIEQKRDGQEAGALKENFRGAYRKGKEEKPGKKNSHRRRLRTAAVKASLEQMEGGDEVYDSCQTMKELAVPVIYAADAGKRLYRQRAGKAERRKKKRKEKPACKKELSDTRKTSGAGMADGREKKNVMRSRKARKPSDNPGGISHTGTGPQKNGITGAEGEQGRLSVKKRMLRRMVGIRKAGQQSGKPAVKDMIRLRFMAVVKHMLRYAGILFLFVFALAALLALPVIIVLAVIYNSPLAIFFPSISSAESTQDVLAAYTAEFNRVVEGELAVHPGYDAAWKVYAGFEGVEEPDNFSDILAVYMVKYGNGDTATDMTDTAKANLKAVFEDMRSYSVTEEMETMENEDGTTEAFTIKKVKIELKTCRDMISVYGFDEEEQEMLEELMSPEYRAAISPEGPAGGTGTGGIVGADQYQAILDAVSDENGKKVVAFALSRVGYPYSQAYRSSGNYYDCSSLAYYAWKEAGVDIGYGGSNTAAAEGRYCYENHYLVSFEEMQPGDLVFYSYGGNGRFMNITHVAIYVGDGNAVEAVNEQIGVICHAMPTGSIVFIGRPRG